MVDTVQTAIYRMSVQGQADVDAATRSVDGLAVAEDKLTRATRASEQGFDRLLGRLDPAIKAHQQYEKTLEQVDRYAQAGIGTEQQRAQAVALAGARYQEALGKVGVSNDNVTKSTGLARYELINLSRQLQDVGVSLASGQSPFTVLVQQGTQVADIFSSSEATVGGFFKQVTGWLGGFLSAGKLVFGGIVTAIGSAVMALMSYSSAQRDVQRALVGQGQASGATVGSINRIAGQAATPFGLSVSEAREVASALAATGKIGVDAIGGIVAQAHNLSILMGGDVKAATQLLAKSFSDPVKGASELNEMLGFLDAKTQDYIRSLTAQGDRQKAINVLIDAAAPSLARAAELTTFWSKAWNLVANAASNAYNWVGKTLDRMFTGGTPEEQLAAINSQLAGRSRPTGGGFAAAAQAQAYDKLIEQQKKLQDQIKKTADDAVDAANRQRSLEIQVLVDGVTQEVRARQELEDKIKNVSAAMADPRIAAHLKNMEQTGQAVERLKGALDTLLTPMQREAQQAQISLDAIKARSPAQLGDIAARQKALEIAGQEYTAAERATVIDNARRQAAAQASFQLSEAARERLLTANQGVQSAQLEIDLIGKNIGEQTRLRADLQTRQQLEQEAARNRTSVDEAEYARLQKINAELGNKALLRAKADINSQIDFARQTAFLTPEDVQIVQQLRDIYGNDIPSALASSEAAALRLNNAFSDFSNSSRDILKSFASDMRTSLQSGANAWQAFGTAAGNALNKIADKLMNMAIDNLWSKAFGGVGSNSLLGLFGINAGIPNAPGAATNYSGFNVTGLPGAALASARGNVFHNDNLVAFAMGGLPDLVNSPTIFPMANGGVGLYGEAGDEAIMPLRRGSDGRLGVTAAGGSATHISVGGSTFVIQGNADQETLKLLQAELDKRDRELPTKIVETMRDAKSRRIA